MKMMMNKYELKRILLDWFFPNRCPLCSKVIGRMDYICDKCACEFEYNEKEESLCGGRLLSVCRYNNKTSPVVIGAKKHRDGSKISFMAYTLVQKITGCYETLPDVIVPVFKNVFAEKLREYLLPSITTIYDFKTEKVFSKALVATSILVCEKGKNTKQILYKNKDDKTNIKIPKTSLKQKWVFKLEEQKSKTTKLKFGDFFNAQISIATLLNKAFIIKPDVGAVLNCCIEEDVIRPAKSPRNLSYAIDEQIIFPYYYENDKLMKYKPEEFEKKYPVAFQHLKTFENELEKRNKDTSAEWFEYGRSQALSHLNQEKLLISTVVTDNIKVYELTKEDIPYSGIYITSKNGTSLEQAKQILNSKDFIEYVNNIGIQASGKSLRITPKDINNFEFVMEDM